MRRTSFQQAPTIQHLIRAEPLGFTRRLQLVKAVGSPKVFESIAQKCLQTCSNAHWSEVGAHLSDFKALAHNEVVAMRYQHPLDVNCEDEINNLAGKTPGLLGMCAFLHPRLNVTLCSGTADRFRHRDLS